MSELVMSPPPATTAASRLKRFLSLLAPTLTDIGRHRPIAPPVALAWLLSISTALALRPVLLEAANAQQPGAEAMLNALLAFSALLSPLLVLAKAGLLAGVLWSALVLFNAPQRLRLLVSILLYGEVILLVHGLLTGILPHLGVVPATPGVIHAPWSLSAHVPATSLTASMIAQQLSAFHLAWAVFVAAALRRCAGMAWAGALAAGALAWGAAIVGSAVRVAIFT